MQGSNGVLAVQRWRGRRSWVAVPEVAPGRRQVAQHVHHSPPALGCVRSCGLGGRPGPAGICDTQEVAQLPLQPPLVKLLAPLSKPRLCQSGLQRAERVCTGERRSVVAREDVHASSAPPAPGAPSPPVPLAPAAAPPLRRQRQRAPQRIVPRHCCSRFRAAALCGSTSRRHFGVRPKGQP